MVYDKVLVLQKQVSLSVKSRNSYIKFTYICVIIEIVELICFLSQVI